MSSNADAQTDKNQVKGINIFITITNGYRKGSVLRQKGVGEQRYIERGEIFIREKTE